ncbi:general stress protein 26 [Staphylococcus gallinarum]|uniref:General stress protein 26 n=1 Tax=Staphylococcus gallinarum TaxID=1293 RepID=A0A380FAW0_STAGA|nr:general stress protein 26 [Staphylococcus gallinarum]
MMDTHFILRQALSLKKIAEFKDNPKAHVLIGYDETNNRSFLEIDANVEILKDQETI